MIRFLRRGFTLVELAIVVAIAGLLFAGLWGLLLSSNSGLSDGAVARQHLQVVQAVRSFLSSSDGAAWAAGPPVLATNQYRSINIVSNLITPGYLPANFGGYPTNNPPQNAYGHTYEIIAQNLGNNRWRYMVVTRWSAASQAINDTRGGAIAGLMGNEGGFIYSNDINGSGSSADDIITARGGFGAWVQDITTFGPAVAPGPIVNFANIGGGRVASFSFVNNDTSVDPWLARVAMSGGTPGFNSMATELFMAGNTLNLSATTGATTGGGTLNVAGGTILLNGGTINGNAGFLNAATNPFTVNGPAAAGAIALQVSDGDVFVTDTVRASSFIYASDARLKTDLQPVAGPLEKLLRLRGYRYQLAEQGSTELGVVAQEVAAVFPELVVTGPDGTLGVKYGNFVAPIIEALRELQSQNDALRQEVRVLRDRIEILERPAVTP